MLALNRKLLAGLERSLPVLPSLITKKEEKLRVVDKRKAFRLRPKCMLKRMTQVVNPLRFQEGVLASSHCLMGYLQLYLLFAAS